MLVDNSTRSFVLDAIELFEKQTCIKFMNVNIDDPHTDHIILFTPVRERCAKVWDNNI